MNPGLKLDYKTTKGTNLIRKTQKKYRKLQKYTRQGMANTKLKRELKYTGVVWERCGYLRVLLGWTTSFLSSLKRLTKHFVVTPFFTVITIFNSVFINGTYKLPYL